MRVYNGAGSVGGCHGNYEAGFANGSRIPETLADKWLAVGCGIYKFIICSKLSIIWSQLGL